MKIALKAPSGLYMSAEDGGGIDTREPGAPVAVRANRPEIGAWETFDTEKMNDTQVALRTSGGFYLTAEGGGGGAVRTNAESPGPWETFTLSGGVFVTWDGLHVLKVASGADPVVDATGERQQGFTVEVLEQPVPPSPPADVNNWKGSFVIPDALPGIPYGDGKRIWTPAYGCYDDNWRAQMRTAYRRRGYTHFPYNCAGLPYGSDYPELADDSSRVARDLDELKADGIIAVVFATDDRNPTVLCQSFIDNAAHIPICVPVWEMNGPLGDSDKAVEEQNCKDAITRTRNAAPNAQCYLHFTPGHGSISYSSEIGGWQWCQDHGTVGLLAQGDNRFEAEAAQAGGEGLESTAVRLAGMSSAPPAWHGMHQLTVKFEYGIYDMYHSNVQESATRQYTMDFLAFAPTVSGYCDGGY